ncbi:unnamed protein product [Orchesella dallaii]|uniref:RNase H type-1 domain-containing protein n=1 Tax=Orchesella dallaii TaxID=48710 RepID=A0ABP1PXC4_9HEXA
MKIRNDSYDFILFTDASLTGWGAHCGNTKTHGFWSEEQTKCHINELELMAVLYGLKTFINSKSVNVLIRSDSTTAISYINKYGGCRSVKCHDIAAMIWKWCEDRDIWLFASYISTNDNVIADMCSRVQVDSSEFKLSEYYFKNICSRFFVPKIDLFASIATRQCSKYYSWYPDPESSGVDAFTFKWDDSIYAFPPFNLVGRTLRKIMSDNANGLVVVPFWQSQPWFPLFQYLCTGNYVLFGPSKKLLFSPYTNRAHPLWRTLQVAVGVVSPRL